MKFPNSSTSAALTFIPPGNPSTVPTSVTLPSADTR